MIKNRTYTVLLLILFTLALKAQEVQGPYFVYTVLKNQSISKTYSNFCQKNHIVYDDAAHGDFEITGTKCDPTIIYTPDTDFLGRDTVKYEYKEYYSNKIKYWSFVFVVVNSTIELEADYYIVDKNQGNTDIYPLTNDISSIGSYLYLKLKSLSAANQLIVSQPNDTTIRFRPETDSTGLAYISYTVCDTFNTCVDGNIVINIVDINNLVSDTMHLGTPKNTRVNIPLPQTGYSTSVSPKKGYLEYNSDNSVVTYKPATGVFGLDTFKLVKNNITRTVFAEIYFVKDPSKITVNDIVFTPKDSVVEFNVATNDIVHKYPFLLDQGPNRGTLTKLNNQGDFSYVPEAGYEGVQSFTYKVCPQGLCEYGEVKIFIGNWQPDTRNVYQFSTPKHVPLVISYHIPINAYNFSSPNDSVKFYPGYDTVYLNYKGCLDTAIGYNQLIYFPPNNFADTTSIDISYCIPSSGECVEAVCEVIVFDESKNCNKQCAGDCVWPGDVNLDGEVTMLDFLEVGYNLGHEGPSRMYQSTGIFRALRAEDWDSDLMNGYSNVKHADTDGNGEVNCADTVYIDNFYRRQHSLVPTPVYDRGEFPFILNIIDPNVDIGDIAEIEIQIGDENNPVINLGGFSYELDYNTDVVDESSLGVNFYKNGWATLNSALMHMYQKPWDGRLESGFVRSNGNKVSGKGGVEKLSFIVEDDLGGLRKEGKAIQIPFYFKNILVLGDDGRYVQLPDQVAYLTIAGTDVEPELNPADLLVYPNPTNDVLNVHLNGKNQLISMALYSFDGALIKEIKNSDQKHELFDVQNLPNGLYLLRAETTLGPISKKIEVFR
jgi:hypothetical protein